MFFNIITQGSQRDRHILGNVFAKKFYCGGGGGGEGRGKFCPRNMLQEIQQL